MKLRIMILLFAAGTCGTIASAQKSTEISTSSLYLKNTPAPLNEIERNSVPSKAIRHFLESFKNEKGEKWQKSKNGLTAFFTVDGMQQLAFYDAKGAWISTVRNYGQNGLPKSVYNGVRSTYYDHAITHCSQIENGVATTYVITILKDDDFKTLRVTNGEIEVIKQYRFYKPVSQSSE